MGKYRRKPSAIIEAIQVTTDADPHPPAWWLEAIQSGRIYWQGGDSPYYTVETSNGPARAHVGDWIIRAADGSLYQMAAAAFAVAFEPAE